jgi:hypothetical protein
MKLTKLQRYTMYCILLQEIDYRPTYICHLWYWIFEEKRFLPNEDNLAYILPELWNNRTANNTLTRIGDTWFNNYKERISALKKCIEETHPDFKQ